MEYASINAHLLWGGPVYLPCVDGVRAPRCVDLACDTGDVSRLLATQYPQGTVLGLDLTKPMLDLVEQQPTPANLSFTQRDMCDTGLETGSIDIVTGSYALRNAPDLGQALVEIKRILKPNGVAAFLDFSKPSHRPLQVVEYGLLKSRGSFWGLVLHGNPEIYAYISESLANLSRSYPTQRKHDGPRFYDHRIASFRFYFGVMEMLILKGNRTQ